MNWTGQCLKTCCCSSFTCNGENPLSFLWNIFDNDFQHFLKYVQICKEIFSSSIWSSIWVFTWCVCLCVCVCVWERESERERERERERESLCLCVRERKRVSVCVWEEKEIFPPLLKYQTISGFLPTRSYCTRHHIDLQAI